MDTKTTETPQEVRDRQVIVPAWMEKILTQAEAEGKNLIVTRTQAVGASYVIALELTDNIIMEIPELAAPEPKPARKISKKAIRISEIAR